MLTNKKIVVPTNLINLAKKTLSVPVGFVCAHHESTMISAKQAYELSLIEPIFIGDKQSIMEEANKLSWSIDSFQIFEENNDQDAAIMGAKLASENKIKVLIKGNLHTDILMRVYLKKEYSLIEGKRLSHIWQMTLDQNDKPLFITDGALNVAPRLDVKMHILKNAVDFANKIGISRPKVSILSATEEVLESVPSSVEANLITKKAKEERINADVFGPLAFDNSVSKKSAAIKKIKNEVAGNTDILLVPNVETGNALVKMMIYFMGACAAGVVVGCKSPVVITSRSDESEPRLASIAAAVVALEK